MLRAHVSSPARTAPAIAWVLVAWTICGLGSLLFSLGAGLLLSFAAESFVLVLSVIGGVAIVFWALHEANARGKAFPRPKRVLLLAVGVPTYALLTGANLYLVLTGVHNAMAQPTDLSTRVTASVREHLPWRSCTHRLYMKETMYPFTRYCVPNETGESLPTGAPALVRGSTSPIGFLTKDVSPLQANRAVQTDAPKSAPR